MLGFRRVVAAAPAGRADGGAATSTVATTAPATKMLNAR
jgi:hypothetical protein